MGVTIDITGVRYGLLKALTLEGVNVRGERLWRCQCDCGQVVVTRQGSLRSGNTKSCGCVGKEKIGAVNRTHGASGSVEYMAWISLRDRCGNPNNKEFRNYGGRGIKVCERWLNSFENFLTDMGKRPPGMSIERDDVNGDYEPNNCRWATAGEQARNKRNNRIFCYDGLTMTMTDWAAHLGVSLQTLNSRRRAGWSVERILAVPKETISADCAQSGNY